MTKISKIITALALSACLSLGVVGVAACTGTAGENGKSAYEIAVENGFTGTEQEWLASLKGADGKDGENGTDGVDGINGVDGANGANGTNGTNGTNGENGKDGNGWHYGNGEPAEEVGAVGDLYLDLANGDVWTKEEDGWQKSELNIKGGEQSDESVIKDFGHIDMEPSSDVELSFEDVEYGTYYLVADTSDETARDSLYARWGTYSYDMNSNLYSGYAAVILVREGVETVTLHSGLNALSLEVKLVPFVAPTIVNDKEVEIPVYSNPKTNTNDPLAANDYIAIPIDSSLQGQKVKITITCLGGSSAATIVDNTDAHNTVYAFNLLTDRVSGVTGAYTKEIDLSQDNFKDITEICLFTTTVNSSYRMSYNFLIKIELV